MIKHLAIPIALGLTGCASFATSVAISSGVQIAGEQLLIHNNRPVVKCHVINVLKGNNMCRIQRTYKARL